jgi:hypothetical protein
MASGHVNRTIRPNTWPQPTKAQYVQKVLANREPSTLGTSATLLAIRYRSAFKRIADICRRPNRSR